MVTRRIDEQQVLVVNGDIARLKAIAKSLESEDMQAVCCTNASEALKAVEQHELRVAIVDAELAGSGAFTLVKELKIINPELRAIVQAAPATCNSKQKPNGDIFAFVHEVDDPEELLTKVQKAFDPHMADNDLSIEAQLREQIERLTETNRNLREEITERKQAGENLRRNEEKYRLLVENSRVCICEIDLDGMLTSINRAGPAMLDATSKDEMVGKPYLEFVPKRERDKVSKLLETAIGGTFTTFQFSNANGDCLESSLVPIADAGGKFLEIMALTEDITQRRQDQDKLLKSKSRLLQAQSVARMGFWDWNLEIDEVELSDEVIRLYGLEPGIKWVAPDLLASLVYFADLELVQNNLELALKGEKKYSIDHRVIRPDGEVIWVQAQADLVCDDDGKPRTLLGTVVDITARKQASNQFATQSEVLQMIALGAELPEVLARLCLLIEQQSAGALCSILLFDETDRKLRNGVGPSLPAEYAAALNGLMTDEGQGSCGTCVARGEQVIVRDIAEDPLWANFRDLALKHGIRSCWSTPFFSKTDKVLGTFAISHEVPCSPTPHHQQLIQMATHLASIIVERMQTDEALQKSEKRYRTLYEENPVMYFTVDANGKVLSVNKFGSDQLGYAPDELLDQPVQGVFYPEDTVAVKQQLDRCLQNPEQIINWEFRKVRKDGSLMWVKESARAIQAPDGNQIILIVCQDITERKLAEENLRANEERLRAIYDQSNDAIFLMDLEHDRILDFNQAAVRLLGYSAEELQNVPISMIHPDETDKIESFAKSVLERRGGRTQELTCRTKSGERLPTEMSASYVEIKGESYLLALVHDISERRRTQEQVRKLSVALEQIPAAVMIADTSGAIEYVNPRFTQMNGYSFDEVIGKSPRMLDSGDKSAKEYEQIWEIIVAGQTWRGEFHNKKKNGKSYWASASISPIKNADGQITHFLIVEEDITAKKLITKEKTNLTEQLRHAQKMETVGTLAGGIAHDFNNILQAIQGYVDICMEEVPRGSSVYADLSEVLKATSRATRMVKQLLAFSRHDYQERERVQMRLLVKEALHLLKASLPSTIKIRANILKKCKPVLADPGQIHQVIMNLCTNAYQSMGLDGGVLTVKLQMAKVNRALRQDHPRLVEDTYLELSVTDTGKGMDSNTLDRIFEPFFTTKQVGKGTGLGLSVVHGIVLAHGGDITIESQPEKGTSARVYFPVVEPVDTKTKHPEEVVVSGSERILYVDDEAPVAAVMTRLLKKLGYNVVVKNDSLEALALFRKNPDRFDLVITDQTMPNMTGSKLAEALLELRPQLPIILMSGFGRIDTPNDAKELGIQEFVMKPVMAGELSAAIKRVLQRKNNGDDYS